MPMIEHCSDEDCDVDSTTGCCRECGVWHGDPCPVCNGKGYHRGACALSDDIDATGRVTAEA
jgi:hypothetical protein